MTNYQKFRTTLCLGLCGVFLTLAHGTALAATHEKISTSSLRQIEEEIFEADLDSLAALEIRIAKILQSDTENPSGTYLMSVLLLKMFTLDPGSYALIRQSTELAAQTYELDRKSDLAIAALAGILETSGESSRGLDLIRDAGKRGIKIGWRANLAKARLMFDGRNGSAVLSVLEDVIKEPDYSATLVAPTLIATLTSTYQGEEQIRQLVNWRKKCASLSMDLAIANANALAMNYDDAFKEYAKIIERHPTNSEALISKGIIALSHKKDGTLAIKLFQQAIQHTKNDSDKIAAETHLALALIGQKNSSDRAIKASVQAIADAGDREAVLMTILTSFRKNQGLKPTLSLLDVLHERVPALHLAHALKAELLSEQLGRHKEATRGFTNAITLEPGRSEYYNGRGLAWMGLSDLEAALSDFEAAVATNPSDASARYNIACAQARLGMKAAAIESLAKALDLDERLLSHAQTDKDLLSLHGEPDFIALLRSEPKIFSVAH
ncbi:MAG: tetratricopeptide repeat protein [bacterium]